MGLTLREKMDKSESPQRTKSEYTLSGWGLIVCIILHCIKKICATNNFSHFFSRKLEGEIVLRSQGDKKSFKVDAYHSIYAPSGHFLFKTAQYGIPGIGYFYEWKIRQHSIYPYYSYQGLSHSTRHNRVYSLWLYIYNAINMLF